MMTKNSVLVVILVLASLLFSGCGMFDDDGIFRNKSRDYLMAEEAPYIEVPEGLDGGAVGELYRVPAIPETSVLEELEGTPRPQVLSTNVLEEVVKIQSLPSGRWILINRIPGEVWPRVRSILSRNGVPTARADAGQGLLETVWLEFDDDPANHHRYRFSITQGVQPKSTEISVLHMAMAKEGDIPPWPAASFDEEREKTMLNVLASELAGDQSSGTVSMLAQQIGGESKVDIVTPTGQAPYLLLRLDYDRSWASVGYSVSREHFQVLDQDRSAGVFYVHQQRDEAEDKPGFIRRMLGAEVEETQPKTDFQVLLIRGDHGIEVRVYDAQKADLARSEAVRLLKKIRANLS